jgi:hypothetical protein
MSNMFYKILDQCGMMTRDPVTTQSWIFSISYCKNCIPMSIGYIRIFLCRKEKGWLFSISDARRHVNLTLLNPK